MASSQPIPKILLLLVAIGFLVAPSSGNFYQDVSVVFGDGRAQIQQNGNVMALSMDKASGSGFQSKIQYLYGKLDMQIKLVPGNSAGTVTCFYLHSQGSTWDEIDFEFLGNSTGEPYLIHTNVYTQGKGNREQQFYLWFDPRADFHTYTILWNPRHIVWYIDSRPIREFKNAEATLGVLYPKSQPMRMYSTIWDAEDWATRGGLVKTDWTKAPFTAYFKSYTAAVCSSSAACDSSTNPWFSQELDDSSQQQLKWVQKNYMVYNYCADAKRFPQGLPAECAVHQFVRTSGSYTDVKGYAPAFGKKNGG